MPAEEEKQSRLVIIIAENANGLFTARMNGGPQTSPRTGFADAFRDLVAEQMGPITARDSSRSAVKNEK